MSTGPIRVLHLITELNTGGAEQMLGKLVARMDRDRFRCVVASMTDRGAVGAKIAEAGVPVRELGMGLGRPTPGGAGRLYRLLRREPFHIVQTWLYHADLLGLLAGKTAGAGKVVWGIRCSDMRLGEYRPLTALTVRLCSLLSPLADAIVVNSREGARIHRARGYRTGRMHLIPNGFDTELFRPDPEAGPRLREELGIPMDSVLVGLIARYDPMKDQAMFLRAAGIVGKDYPGVHFVMAGRGVVWENRALAGAVPGGLRGRVHLLGQRDDIPMITAGLDIASSSSAFGEGFSNTIGEAMSCGVPCVATGVGDAADVVGDTGIVVRAGDSKALAGGLRRLLEMGPEGRGDLGARARDRIRREFEIGGVVRRFEDLYERLMGHGRGYSKKA